MFSSVLTNNSNWDCLTRNLVTFNFYIFGGLLKILIFGGRWVPEKPIYRQICLKRGLVCRFKMGKGVWQKRGGGVFEGGVFSSILEHRMHAMTLSNQLTPKQIKNFQTMTA